MGVYTTLRGLNLQKNDIVFYTDTGQPMTELSAECSKSCAQCAADDVPVTTKAPQEASSEFRLADMVILIVLMATCISFVCCLILGFTYFRRKVKGQPCQSRLLMTPKLTSLNMTSHFGILSLIVSELCYLCVCLHACGVGVCIYI